MPQSTKSDNLFIKQRFGGGINTRSSEDEINDRECTGSSKNLELDPQNFNLKPRKPFDLLDTAPNEEPIRGFINLVKTDGTSQIAVQAGDKVYEYQGASSGFNSTPIATVSSAARLRGRIDHNWALTDTVIVTDLAAQEQVIQWDGTTFSDVVFSPSGTQGKAKYCVVGDERAWFMNVDFGSSTPHLLVASTISDYTTVDVSSRPSSSLGLGDPFFLASPDLRPINGAIQEFGRVFFSTEDGRMWVLSGTDATNYRVDEFFPRSFASGAEAIVGIGNLVLYGRRGRIELLSDTDRFADTEANDITLKIADQIQSYKDWTIAYNNRTQKAYCFSENQSEVWVLHVPVIPTGMSPWMRYQTDHPMAFQPTAVMNMIDPDDGLEYVFMGDSSGNFFRMEGTNGNGGDGGTNEIDCRFIGRNYTLDQDQEMSDFTGYMRYKKRDAYTTSLSFLYSGKQALDQSIQINVPSTTGSAFYNNDQYYNNSEYYGAAFSGRLLRQVFDMPGSGEDLQMRIDISSDVDWQINEVGTRFGGSNV